MVMKNFRREDMPNGVKAEVPAKGAETKPAETEKKAAPTPAPKKAAAAPKKETATKAADTAQAEKAAATTAASAVPMPNTGEMSSAGPNNEGAK